MNEKFVFEGKINQPKMLNLKVNSVKGTVPLIIENGEIKLVSDEPLGFKVQQTYIYKKEENDRSY